MVVGCGSIGRRHALNLKSLGIKQIALCDLDKSRLDTLSGELGGAPQYTDYRVAIEESGADTVVVCAPTSLHVPVALEAVRAGKNIFLEKPISDGAAGVQQLLETAAGNGVVAMMGMCYRFHPGLLKVKELLDTCAIGKVYTALSWGGHYLPYWHPWADYRHEYSAQRRLGGGVILDSIHALDTMRWILGEAEEVICMYGKVSNLEIDTEDVASMVFRLANGAIAEVHVDYLNKNNTSLFYVVGEKGALDWDYSRNVVRMYRDDTKEWEEYPYQFETNDMYLREIEYFLGCVQERGAPSMDLADGWRTLQLALAAKLSSDERRVVRVSEVQPGQ